MLLKWTNLVAAAALLIGNGCEAFQSCSNNNNNKPLTSSPFGYRRQNGVVTSANHGMVSVASSPLILAATSTTSSSGSRSSRPRKKSVQDRTQEEAVSLIRDMVEATMEAGPRAGPARTFQAYLAVTQTLRDFSPFLGGGGEAFSAPVALRKLFERLGATYIKLGQFVASSPTLFPKEYVLEFQKCLDATEPLPWNVIESVIESELGPISKNFASIDKKPLASASIAQVHVARLETGEEVVIKVQKPRIDESLKADLNFIYIGSRILEFLQPDFERTSMSAISGDIRKSMLEELDFEMEANNMEEFRTFLKLNDLTDVATAPKVYRDLTTKKVLTMDRLRGVSMTDAESIAKITNDPESTIIKALNVWTTSVMTMPWFHADVHAGNLLVLEDGRVGFIDFGLVGRVGEKTFKAVNELSGALATADYQGMAEALLNMGATDGEVDTNKFGKDIESLMSKIGGMQTDVTITGMADGSVAGSVGFNDNEITNVLLEMVEVMEDNGLKLPREFGLLVKQSLYFDRYLKILAPELDVVGDSRVGGLGSTDTQLLPSVENKNSEIVIDV